MRTLIRLLEKITARIELARLRWFHSVYMMVLLEYMEWCQAHGSSEGCESTEARLQELIDKYCTHQKFYPVSSFNFWTLAQVVKLHIEVQINKLSGQGKEQSKGGELVALNN